jgi:hypothetical protein
MDSIAVFVSAATDDLRTVRKEVRETLAMMKCRPEEESVFEPDSETVSKMLRKKISSCDAVIFIIGFRYGGEPWGGDVFADSASSYSGWLMRASNWAGLRYSMPECFLSKL